MFAPQATTTPPKICLAIPRPPYLKKIQFSSSIIQKINSTAQHTNSAVPTVRFGASRQASPHPNTKTNGRERLQETYMVAAVAGEGEEVDLVAVADAAVLPQVGELRRAHPAEPRAPAPGEPRSEDPPRRRPRVVAATAPPQRQEGRRKKGGAARSSNGRDTKSNKHTF